MRQTVPPQPRAKPNKPWRTEHTPYKCNTNVDINTHTQPSPVPPHLYTQHSTYQERMLAARKHSKAEKANQFECTWLILLSVCRCMCVCVWDSGLAQQPYPQLVGHSKLIDHHQSLIFLQRSSRREGIFWRLRFVFNRRGRVTWPHPFFF